MISVYYTVLYTTINRLHVGKQNKTYEKVITEIVMLEEAVDVVDSLTTPSDFCSSNNPIAS